MPKKDKTLKAKHHRLKRVAEKDARKQRKKGRSARVYKDLPSGYVTISWKPKKG